LSGSFKNLGVKTSVNSTMSSAAKWIKMSRKTVRSFPKCDFVRRFNVRVENALTHKSQYLWINEDKISQEDVAKLVEMYRRHIEEKLTINPGL
jgi:hypothetical protein